LHFNIKSILNNHGFGNKNDYQNIYIILYNSLKDAIINKNLQEGFKLPPTRVLANDLEISRSTVIKAYELLVLENYVKSIKGSGYYINSQKKLNNHISSNSRYQHKYYPSISKRGVAFQKNIHIINNVQTNNEIAFKPGLPPLDIFPINIWKNLSNEYWNNIKSSELSYSKAYGLQSLRENISNYLKIYRNITCDANQIIITTGSLHSLYLLANAIIDKGDKVLMESLTYPHAYRLFKSLQAKISQIDLDKDKIIDSLKNKKPKFFYTIPSNQNYLGNNMSLSKRLNLLEWASKNGALIIEDDYEQEFSNWKSPLPSIYSLDKQERVVYLGTFNKLLIPSIRLGYMIVPDYLHNAIINLISQSNRFVSPELQQIMSLFIEKDYLNKHIRKVVSISNERKEIFTEHFKQHFGTEIVLDQSSSGLNILGKFNSQNVNDEQVSEYLKQKGIVTNPLSKYYIKNPNESGLVMGYSCVNNKLIKENIQKMAKAYDDFLKTSSTPF
jgi:GntR family transcriptional regulator/MocR family aminotransferase